jgi:hypothetical protein
MDPFLAQFTRASIFDITYSAGFESPVAEGLYGVGADNEDEPAASAIVGVTVCTNLDDETIASRALLGSNAIVNLLFLATKTNPCAFKE